MQFLRSLVLALLAAVALAAHPVVRTHPGEEGRILAAKLLQQAAEKFATRELPVETMTQSAHIRDGARKLQSVEAVNAKGVNMRAHSPEEGKRLAEKVLAARKAKKSV